MEEELFTGEEEMWEKVKSNLCIEQNYALLLKRWKCVNFDVHHPDVTKEEREYIYALMESWPRVSFIEHCLITYFFTIRQAEDITYEINPQEDSDVKENNDEDLLGLIE